ncbi:FecR family protein [Thiohalorhabdus sp. Cl-TMA]|uniref:FecR domain-containing protein n=1 Tax=Thiohalorhabdus methylotrophus TaxID=3242694 RepID=A0ABV4TYT6_9GAMM
MTAEHPEQASLREEAIDWLLLVEAAPEDENVRAELAAWRRRSAAHEAAYRSVADTWQLAESLPRDYAERFAPASPSGPETGREVRGRRSTRIPPMRIPGGRLTAGMAATALLAGLLTLWAPWLYLGADYLTGVGEVRKVALGDGSTVYLGAESAVSVRYGPSARRVRLLRGRAFFEVEPSAERPFSVSTGAVTATAKGTAYGVEAGEESVSVAVRSGSVEVRLKGAGGRSVQLSPGERLRMARDTGTVSRTRTAVANIASWREGRLVVDGMTLTEVIERIGHHHRGMIWLRDRELAGQRVTGVFNLDHPLAALRAAAGTRDARVTEYTPYLVVVSARE